MNGAGQPIAGASVQLQSQERSVLAEAQTRADGSFVINVSHAGGYTLRAQKLGFQTAVAAPLNLSAEEHKRVNLTLKPLGANASSMEFDDKPSFTIAGVTDWTAAGGHGSDTNLRTSEALTKETRALKSGERKEARSGTTERTAASRENQESENKLRASLVQSPRSFEANQQLGEFYLRSERYRDAIPLLESAHQIRPADSAAAYDLALAYKADGNFTRATEQLRTLLAGEDRADFHRLLGDIHEQQDDPLGAVHEYEQAARLDPSEQNYFAWGTELLLHRAIQPAVEVLAKGAARHPQSARMLSAWGAALYADGAYDEAALRLCAASDLRPDDSTPYLFLGKMEIAAPRPLSCVDQKLAHFVQAQPENALANYYYALALWKRQRGSENRAVLKPVQTFLEKAITIDPRFDEAYLQLGILRFSQGDFDEASAAFTKAIDLNPNNGEAHYRLGVAYKRLGRKAEAAREFQTHEQIQKADAALIDRQRRELRQFVTVLKGQAEAVSPQ